MLHYCAPGKIHTRCRALPQAMGLYTRVIQTSVWLPPTTKLIKHMQNHVPNMSPTNVEICVHIEIQEPWLPVTIRVSLMSVWISSGNVPWLLKAVARSGPSHENQISISKHLYIQDKLNEKWKTNLNPLKTIDNKSILFNTGYQKTTRCSPRTRMQSRRTLLWNKLFEQSTCFPCYRTIAL